ncbi:MAG: phosphoenolpyruvate--protein phosphotransferase, partial [bacterium]|nr:phosphoenolpyruvate--protein phosphotransferase [bacterium]
RLLHYIARAAHLHGIWVGICGEMTAIPAAAFLLLGMSYDELSTSPIAIEEIKETIRNVKYIDARQVANGALKHNSGNALLDYLESSMKELGLELGIS